MQGLGSADADDGLETRVMRDSSRQKDGKCQMGDVYVYACMCGIASELCRRSMAAIAAVVEQNDGSRKPGKL